MIDTVVIIVNWNGKNYLDDCMNALFTQSYKKFMIVFVDNASSDGSVSYLKKKYSSFIAKDAKIRLHIIQNKENHFFSKANNIGIHFAWNNTHIDKFVFLNNDTIVDKDWLKELITVAHSKEHIGMVSSKSLFPPTDHVTSRKHIHHYTSQDYSSSHRVINTLGLKINSVGLGFDISQTSELDRLFCPSGVAMLYKRKTLDDIKYRDGTREEFFDELFYGYCEDLDLGFRARNKGWIAAHAPKSLLFHIHMGSSKKNPYFSLYLVHRNGVWVTLKNFSVWRLILLSPLLVLYHVGAIFYRPKWGYIACMFRAKYDALKKIRQIWKKRTL